MKALGWLIGGNDRQLAATSYAGRESATQAKERKEKARTRAARAKSRAKSARAGQAWEDADRRRFSR